MKPTSCWLYTFFQLRLNQHCFLSGNTALLVGAKMLIVGPCAIHVYHSLYTVFNSKYRQSTAIFVVHLYIHTGTVLNVGLQYV